MNGGLLSEQFTKTEKQENRKTGKRGGNVLSGA